MKEFHRVIRTLCGFMAMLSVSVLLIERLVKHCKDGGSRRILVAGSSSGGYITNLHHIHFKNADVYTPLLAGLAMDDTFLESVYSKGVAVNAKENPGFKVTVEF